MHPKRLACTLLIVDVVAVFGSVIAVAIDGAAVFRASGIVFERAPQRRDELIHGGAVAALAGDPAIVVRAHGVRAYGSPAESRFGVIIRNNRS